MRAHPQSSPRPDAGRLRLAVLCLAAWALLLQVFAAGVLAPSPAAAASFEIGCGATHDADDSRIPSHDVTCLCPAICAAATNAIVSAPDALPPRVPYRLTRQRIEDTTASRAATRVDIRARGPPASLA